MLSEVFGQMIGAGCGAVVAYIAIKASEKKREKVVSDHYKDCILVEMELISDHFKNACDYLHDHLAKSYSLQIHKYPVEQMGHVTTPSTYTVNILEDLLIKSVSSLSYDNRKAIHVIEKAIKDYNDEIRPMRSAHGRRRSAHDILESIHYEKVRETLEKCVLIYALSKSFLNDNEHIDLFHSSTDDVDEIAYSLGYGLSSTALLAHAQKIIKRG